MRLTDLALKSLKPGVYRDDRHRGFGVRVGKHRKTFFVMTGTDRKVITLGHYPALDLKSARRKAMRIQGTYQPSDAVTYLEAVSDFVEQHCKRRNKASTAIETERLLRRFSFSQPIDRITKRDIHFQLADMTPSEANHSFTAIRTLLNWCVAHDYLVHTPLHKVRLPHKANTRDRLLTDEEVTAIWLESYSHGSFGSMVRILLLTGQRLNQIASLQSSWLHRTSIIFPAYIMKNNTEHTIPLTTSTKSELGGRPRTNVNYIWGDKPLTNVSNPMDVLREALPNIPHWTLHDFRRYFSSTMAKLKVPQEVTEKLLAHKTGKVSGVAAIYNRHAYELETREALEKFHAHLEAIGSNASEPSRTNPTST